MAKSLSQQLADYMKPQNLDFDIEDSERVSGNEDEAPSDNEQLTKGHYLKSEKSKLRDNKVQLKEAKYQGKTSSRKELFEDLGASNGSSAAFDKASEDSEESGVDLSASESDASEVSENESGSESEQEDDAFKATEINEHKINKVKQLLARENESKGRRNDNSEEDAVKGFHVFEQQKQYDSIVDSRIKFQKSLTAFNQIPHDSEVFAENSSEKTQKYIKKAIHSLESLADSVIRFRVELHEQANIRSGDKNVALSKKRNFSEFMKETELLDNGLNEYRTEVLKKWSQKVQAASGSTALNASKFKVINQTAATQVDNNLAQMDRLVKKTRVNRRNVKPIGFEESQDIDESEKIFDDEDFYRLLLRDLIDKKVNDSVTLNETFMISLTKSSKMKKKVDTKASKGRKLNYKVQEPIQNYMAPKLDKSRWDDYQIDEFFAGLFGQRINMNENENEGQDGEAADEQEIDIEAAQEAEAIAADDIQLFA